MREGSWLTAIRLLVACVLACVSGAGCADWARLRGTGLDAGPPDVDAAPRDAGAMDAPEASRDAASVDAGEADGGATDAARDAGATDSATPDAHIADSGPPIDRALLIDLDCEASPLVDRSPLANTVDCVGGCPVITTLVGRPGRVCRFDGAAYLEVPGRAEFGALRAFSVALWIHCDPLRTCPGMGGTLIRMHSAGAVAFKMEIENPVPDEVTFRVGLTGGRVTFGDLSRPEWHHLAGTFDGSRILVYYDGARVGSPTTATTSTGPTDPIWIGGYSAGERLDGYYVDDFRFWSRELTADEIMRLATTP